MGVYNYLYTIDCKRRGNDTVALKTEVFGAELGEGACFSWIDGDHPPGLYGYADNTMFCDKNLPRLRPYPRTSVQELGEKVRNGPPSCLVEMDWQPEVAHSSTVVHVSLPRGYVPRSDLEPLQQPCEPFVKRCEDRFVLTWGSDGRIVVRFCITPLGAGESLDDFNTAGLLAERETRNWKTTIGLNLLFAKFEVRET